MKKKILKVVVFSFVVAVAAISVDYGMNKENSSMSTLLSQVEAIAGDESEIPDVWKCKPGPQKCIGVCGACGVRFEASGMFVGVHVCPVK